MNYTTLVTTIKGYCENEFPLTVSSFSSADQIDTFIKQAEQRIHNSIQFPSLRKNVTGALTASNKYISTPEDFLSVYSISVIDPTSGEHSFLLNKDVSFIRAIYPDPAYEGVPQFYALFGPTTTDVATPVITNELSIILGPTPDVAYSTELHYYYYPESIVTASTTWLGDNFDSLLLSGALMEAATFMKSDEDTMKVYKARYDEALALAKRLGDGLERTDAYRTPQVAYPVR